jgi:membrane protein DedA with SNARE-associated domain
MNFAVFSLWTILGAGLWNIILLAIGYYASDKQDMILMYIKEIIIGLLVLVALYIGYKWYQKSLKK